MANVFFKDFTPIIDFNFKNRPTHQESITYFTKFLENFSFFQKDDLIELEKYWSYCSYDRNKFIVTPGEVTEYLVFICKGAVRHFTEDKNGQHIINFTTDCNFILSLNSLKNQEKTIDGYVTSKDSHGLKISYKNYQQLIKTRPAFEQFFDLFAEKERLLLLNRLTSFQSADANERYLILLNEQPDVFDAFTMNDISNYLGINPETLSRLKKKNK